MTKAVVNEDLCVGCGACESLCPSMFKIEDGKSKILSEECKDCDCQGVVDSCPVNAISLE